MGDRNEDAWAVVRGMLPSLDEEFFLFDGGMSLHLSHMPSWMNVNVTFSDKALYDNHNLMGFDGVPVLKLDAGTSKLLTQGQLDAWVDSPDYKIVVTSTLVKPENIALCNSLTRLFDDKLRIAK